VRLAAIGAHWSVRLLAGGAAGLVIVFVDNVWAAGEVSPIVVVAFLLVATFLAAAAWGERGWLSAAATWACVPLAHVVKHLLGMPDTLQPNTYLSMLYLAGFCLVVSVIGFVLGLLVHRMRRDPAS
jgi:asparagine N-glycosylation enzyme membrane subunit Stt3